MKKGFTLIELLGVIILIAALTALITPKVVKMINNAEENTRKQNANELLKAAEYKAANLDITNSGDLIIDYTTKTNIDKLEYTGEVPEAGKITILMNGNISMAVKLGDKCYIKETYEKEFRTYKYTDGECTNKIPTVVTSGDGLYNSVTEPGRLIYRGANPNNYIELNEGTPESPNNVLYRIISYETDGTIKVIRDEEIGNMAWDANGERYSDGTNNTFCNSNSGCNAWGTPNNTFFNGTSLGNIFSYRYYNSASATTLSTSASGTVNTEATLNKYLNNGGWAPLEYLEDYIDNHKFYVGGVYYAISYHNGAKGKQKEREEESLYTWNGKVGLINLTEYTEASLNDTCDVFTNFRYNPDLYYYKDEGATSTTVHTPATGWPCAQSNWILKNYNQWTLAPIINSRSGMWTISATGYLDYFNAGSTSFGVRPVFYLKRDIAIGGLGTSINPYRILEDT